MGKNCISEHLKRGGANSYHSYKNTVSNLLGEEETATQRCDGCQKKDIHKHNGLYYKIKDWNKGKTLKYTSLLKR